MTKLIKTKNYNNCDQYLITKNGQTTSLVWQTGTEKEQGVNGLQLVDIIIMSIERLLELDPELSEYENERTLAGLIKALIGQAERDEKLETLIDNLGSMLVGSNFQLTDSDTLKVIRKLYDYEVIENDVE